MPRPVVPTATTVTTLNGLPLDPEPVTPVWLTGVKPVVLGPKLVPPAERYVPHDPGLVPPKNSCEEAPVWSAWQPRLSFSQICVSGPPDAMICWAAPATGTIASESAAKSP